MALETWYSAGTVSVENGSTTVTATGAFWGADAIMPGDLFCDPAQPLVPPQRVKEVTGNAELELWAPWPGDDIEDGEYEIRYVGIIERSTAQSRKVLEQLGDVKAWYDVIVEDDDARLALETEGNPLRAKYRVLVRDDGVIWAKKTSAFDDWIGPVEFKGDPGNKGWTPHYALVEDGDRVLFQLAEWVGGEGVAPDGDVGKYLGSDGFVEDIEDAVDIRGFGFKPRGNYSSGTTYAKGDVTQQNGSSWVAKQAATGNAPPTLPTTSNTYWQLLARAGVDGAGTVTTIAEGTGISVDLTDPEAPEISAVPFAGDSGSGGSLGAVPAPAVGDGAKFLRGDGTWAALAFDTSVLALQVAASSAQAVYGSNWVADSFANFNNVDTSGAANADFSTPGVIKPAGGGNDAYTKVLLHFDGADGSTTITDSNAGGSAHTWTANGNAQLDTGASPKFGTASLLCDGTGDYVSTSDSADFTLGSGDFTIEMWFNVLGGSGGRRALCGHSVGAFDPTTSFLLELDASNHVVAYLGNGTALTAVTGTTAITTSGWHHAEFTRSGTTLRLFVDGVQEGGNVTFSGSAVDVAGILSIGAFGNFASFMWNGLIDEFRLSVGIARHTANFTPRSTAYGSVQNMSVAYLAPPSLEIPESMAATIQIKDVDETVAGTDYKVDFRRSVGGDWVEATFGEEFITPAGIKHVKVTETDISGVDSGDIPSLRFRTLTNKNVELHGVHIEFYGAQGGWQSGGSP
jgi:hypothetical protein